MVGSYSFSTGTQCSDFIGILTSLHANFEEDTGISPKSEFQLVLLAICYVLASYISHMVLFMSSRIALLESGNVTQDCITINRETVIYCRYF